MVSLAFLLGYFFHAATRRALPIFSAPPPPREAMLNSLNP
jgi:hypothetical protein